MYSPKAGDEVEINKYWGTGISNSQPKNTYLSVAEFFFSLFLLGKFPLQASELKEQCHSKCAQLTMDFYFLSLTVIIGTVATSCH